MAFFNRKIKTNKDQHRRLINRRTAVLLTKPPPRKVLPPTSIGATGPAHPIRPSKIPTSSGQHLIDSYVYQPQGRWKNSMNRKVIHWGT